MAGSGFTMLPTRYAGLEAVAASSRHSFPRHTHEEFGIGVITAGGQLSASGRGQVTAGAGDLITVNPGEVHDGVPLRGEARTWFMLYLQPELLASIQSGLATPDAAGFEFHRPVLSGTPASARLMATFSRATRSTDGARNLAIEQDLLELFAPLARERRQAAPKRLCPTLQRVRDMIADQPTRNISLQELADEAGLGRYQTLRAFRAMTGLTPHAYLLQRRIVLARRRIAAGDALAMVAADIGYADQSHMTREFKRRYGLTPAAYRAAHAPCNSVQDA